ncbi:MULTISPECIES: hypothetical protein [Bradyrhizobium]|uniref:Uncharacterized protein n=1 Tax=Bradyrhizobium yuanmingense TaxID=108015 RepID=A0A1C3UQB2_9BRAD|nr:MULTISPECIES: hypothetical protein [Bradyrhizobium]MCA1430212.1 hypothetical protein [Bradyrhizobium sp. NBAIM16]MCA1507952.1 hypothetical protein [Bradyrhizobium sp. NBAIM02]TWI32123.1 hypothetical protein IQ15_00441 [Bradyrhizobium yuanmingense]SCB17666.1 hypothetical protein GA0061099_1002509 [Bradyrhizobium yuanmingense]
MAGGEDDNEEDRSPKLRLVSGNPNARADRQIELAKSEVQNALSQFAAALLRTMAGNDTEAAYLIRRLALVVEAINKFEKQADRGMSAAELQEALCLPQAEMDYAADDDWRYRRWRREDGFDDIVKGALRLAAHKLLGEDPAFGGMHSERVIERGIKTLEELRRPPPPARPRSRQTKDLAGSWEDLVLTRTAEKPKRRFGERLASAPKASAQRPTRRRAGFDEDDLKELRKAIKAKDNKRIAELTAKINRPSFEDPK